MNPKPLHTVFAIILVVLTGSKCTYTNYKPNWLTPPTDQQWADILASGKPLVLYLGEEKIELEEPHMEGTTLVATLGKHLPPDSVTFPPREDTVAWNKPFVSRYQDQAKQVSIFTHEIISSRGDVVRLKKEDIFAVKTFTAFKVSKLVDALLAILIILGLLAVKILPLLI